MTGPYATRATEIPTRWVVERDADDRVPMLINAADFDASRHVAIDKEGNPVGEEEKPAPNGGSSGGTPERGSGTGGQNVGDDPAGGPTPEEIHAAAESLLDRSAESVIEIIENKLVGPHIGELLTVAGEVESVGKKRVTVLRAIETKQKALAESDQPPKAKDEF